MLYNCSQLLKVFVSESCARDILNECGRLKAVGGQEDLIIEVAVRLAEMKGKAV